MSTFKKILAGGVVIAVLLIFFTWHKITSQTKSITTSDQSQQQTSGASTAQSDQPENVKPQVVSDAELARLQSYGKVSSDEKYYIKDADPFPSIVSLETGDAHIVKPGDNYSKVANLTWSADGKNLAYTYEVSDPSYTGMQLFGIIALQDVLSRKSSTAGTIAFADKINFAWLDSNRVLFTELIGYDGDKRFYKNAIVNIYNTSTQQLENPWTSSVANVYSIDIAPSKTKFLYVQAQLDNAGNTSGREYDTADLNGNVLNQSVTYNPNWSK